LLAVIGDQLGLEYEYRENGVESKGIAFARLPDAAASLPAALRADMRKAIAQADDIKMRVLIEQIPPDQAETAHALRTILDRFDWDVLESIVGEVA